MKPSRTILTLTQPAIRVLRHAAVLSSLTTLLLVVPTILWAQTAQPQPPARAPATAHSQAPFDMTGYWMALITRNWNYRMIVPARGNYINLPINLKAAQAADAWNPAADEAAGKACEAYGAPVIMQMPLRLHIHWQGDETLRVDTDSGMQTRLLQFAGPGDSGAATSAPAPSLQGYSRAEWVMHAAPGRRGPGPQSTKYGSLQVVTDHLLPGLLRKNGVPYSSATTVTEWWDLHRESAGDKWLTISIKVQDPEYLRGPWVEDAVFQMEPDGSKWDPTPCSLTF